MYGETGIDGLGEVPKAERERVKQAGVFDPRVFSGETHEASEPDDQAEEREVRGLAAQPEPSPAPPETGDGAEEWAKGVGGAAGWSLAGSRKGPD